MAPVLPEYMATLQFKGKSVIWNHHLSVPYQTLDAVPSLSLEGAGEDENLIIEGDNLVALKSLLPKYQGRVNCIYIDPPYNTGNEGWVYNDKVNNPLIKEWIGAAVGREGEDFNRHDKWLCMMTPRLKILRDLLADDGVIFISIDDNEMHHLRQLLDEVFGIENYVETFSWVKTQTPENLSIKSRQMVEYVICYEKNKTSNKFKGIVRSSNTSNGLLNQSNTAKELTFPAGKVETRIKDKVLKKGIYGTDSYEVELLNDVEVRGGYFAGEFTLRSKFKWVQSKLDYEIGQGTIISIPKETLSPAYRKDNSNPQVPVNLIDDEVGVGTNENAKTELRELFGFDAFQYSKPADLVKYLASFSDSEDSIILDSFAGSGTTAQAVLEMNREDGGNRKFILVQISENTPKNSSAYEAGYKNVQEITQARVKKIIERDGLDAGFTYYRLGKRIDAESILSGDLPTYEEFSKYVYYLATGKNFPAKSKPNNGHYFVGLSGDEAIFLIYEQKFDKLKGLALTIDLVQKMNDEHPGRKIIYAPACFLDDEHLDQYNVTFVGIPFNLFER